MALRANLQLKRDFKPRNRPSLIDALNIDRLNLSSIGEWEAGPQQPEELFEVLDHDGEQIVVVVNRDLMMRLLEDGFPHREQARKISSKRDQFGFATDLNGRPMWHQAEGSQPSEDLSDSTLICAQEWVKGVIEEVILKEEG